jgi:hypothetical protein
MSLDLETFEIDVGGFEKDAYCADSVSSDTPGPKDEITCVICH